MPVYQLLMDEIAFPHPELAEADGLLAIGGDLSSRRLLSAYASGIFPWYNEGDPILWWSPDPRMVLFPEKLHISHSMRPYFNQRRFSVTFDTAFERVIRSCQVAVRSGNLDGTWITGDIVRAYTELHHRGFVHSVEVWQGDSLVGGLYGLALGRVFFGESMFASVTNASKFGLITLVKILEERGYRLIDCQQVTQHLTSLGASPIRRKDFQDLLEKNPLDQTDIGKWTDWLENENISPH